MVPAPLGNAGKHPHENTVLGRIVNHRPGDDFFEIVRSDNPGRDRTGRPREGAGHHNIRAPVSALMS